MSPEEENQSENVTRNLTAGADGSIAGLAATNSSGFVSSATPTQIDEFSVRDILGRGGFGTVYSAFDNTLQREVAIKIPHTSLVNKGNVTELYLREARAIAALDHANIIPVYRAAESRELGFYIVTKMVRGCNLAQWMKRHVPTSDVIVEILAKIGSALAYAHAEGVVHRDIKPGNVLIGANNETFVTDFGLALRDIDAQGGPAYVGTPAYMSPEQARGEGHRVDGRSDIFSLGAVMYVMLTGQRPFEASDRYKLYDEVLYAEPQHPQDINANIPADLSSVCLRAMSKRIANRYQTAEAFVEDLKAARLDGTTSISSGLSSSREPISGTESPDDVRAMVVPKGLRSFDMHDADFYLRLLPGPYGRDGVPEIVRFWLNKTQPGGPDSNVPIGLIYGPSGCGKTSLVRAGIVPRLSTDVRAIYIQASAAQTEQELCEKLAAAAGPLGARNDTESTDVAERFAQIRRSGKHRVVIFIDQFEQWLYAHPDCSREKLTAALRQCDGINLQCILMVRDDFWMGVTRLIHSLDLSIAENVNATSVDLFDVGHAKNVLAEFGAAFGTLPVSPNLLTPNQNRFLDAAVDSLAVGGRIVCVQLALLAEMLKMEAWDRTSVLMKDGGAAIGMHFLSETFDGDSAARRMRLHSEGAHRVLRALLPESGSRIKGSVRTESELLEASAYRDHTQFRALIRILDRELHLITPVDHSDDESLSEDSSMTDPLSTGYQLTHDFLIAPIRQWIAIRSRTTTEGKARLRLEEFSELYQVRPRSQSLPSLADFLSIRRHTQTHVRSDSQRTMLTAATRYHGRRIASICAALLILIAGSFWIKRESDTRADRADGQATMSGLLAASVPDAIEIIDRTTPSDFVATTATAIVASPESTQSRRVRASLVVASENQTAANVLAEYALVAPTEDVVALATQFEFPFSTTRQRFIDTWQNSRATRAQSLRAACMLAADPESAGELESVASLKRLTQLLVNEDPVGIKNWTTGLMPLASKLKPFISEQLQDQTRELDSISAAFAMAAFSKSDPAELASLIPDLRHREQKIITDAIEQAGPAGLTAVQNLYAEISQETSVAPDIRTPWGSPWWVISDREPLESFDPQDLTTEDVDELRHYDALVSDRAILIHRLPYDDLSRVVDKLAAVGYRTAELSPYESDNERFVYLLTIRDQVTSRYAASADADEIKRLNAAHRQDGFIPSTILPYEHDARTKYACVWIKPPIGFEQLDGDLYINVPAGKHEQDGWKKLMDRGYTLTRSNGFSRDAERNESFTSVRWKIESSIRPVDDWNGGRDEYRRKRQLNRSSVTLHARRSDSRTDDPNAGFTWLWWRNIPAESKELAYRGRLDHLRATEQMLSDGYYPLSIHATALREGGVTQFSSTWWRPELSVETVTHRDVSRSKLAFALLQLGSDAVIRAALRSDASPSLRGSAISGFHSQGLPTSWLADLLEAPQVELDVKRSVLMALSQYPSSQVSAGQRSQIETKIAELYADELDPGVRSATELLARKWQLTLPVRQRHSQGKELTTVAGDRLVVFKPPGTIWMGSASTEPGRDAKKEPRTAFKMTHDFAVATREVTISQFRQHKPEWAYGKDYTPTTSCPVIGITWYDAAKYCRWLSEEEGIPKDQMFYPTIPEIGPKMRLPEDAIERTGYRLPTAVEWEYACRGGSDSGRWFGFAPGLIDQHAWTGQNSNYVMHPVASLLPNDYGMFDMLGNGMEWPQTPSASYPGVPTRLLTDRGEEVFDPTDKEGFETRGAAVLYQPRDARASQRNRHAATYQRVYMTFRIARTVKPADDEHLPE